MTTTGWILWFSILGLGCVLMIVGASIESRRMKRGQDKHRHAWRAVAMTNLCRCDCGAETEWWKVPEDEEPFRLGRYWRGPR